MWRLAHREDLSKIEIFLSDCEYRVNYALSKSSIGIPGIIALGFRNGEIMIDSDSLNGESNINGTIIYTIGTYSNNFKDKNVGYVLLFLLKEGAFYKSFIIGVSKILDRMIYKGMETIEFKTEVSDGRNIGLYKKIFFVDRIDQNLNGISSIVFRSPISYSKDKIHKYFKDKK